MLGTIPKPRVRIKSRRNGNGSSLDFRTPTYCTQIVITLAYGHIDLITWNNTSQCRAIRVFRQRELFCCRCRRYRRFHSPLSRMWKHNQPTSSSSSFSCSTCSFLTSFSRNLFDSFIHNCVSASQVVSFSLFATSLPLFHDVFELVVANNNSVAKKLSNGKFIWCFGSDIGELLDDAGPLS